MKQGYKVSSDNMRTGWFEQVKQEFVVWLKKSGIGGADRRTTNDYGIAQKWIEEFVDTGKYPNS